MHETASVTLLKQLIVALVFGHFMLTCIRSAVDELVDLIIPQYDNPAT